MKFIGIDVHLRKLTLSVIDEKLNIEFIGNMEVEEALTYIASFKSVILGIDAPLSLNSGLMNDKDYRERLNVKVDIHYNKKVSEYELSRRGIKPFSTPDNLEVIGSRNDLRWMEIGFQLNKAFSEKGYILLSEQHSLKKNDKGMVEVFPHASFATLLGYIPLKKNTEEGKNERIELLKSIGFKSLDKFINNISKSLIDDCLDALAAAFTAYKVGLNQCSFLGDVKEGQIALPVKEILTSYKRRKTMQLK